MVNQSTLPQRRSIRLHHYDYSTVGNYFVTVCTCERRCIFGSINHGTMQLNQLGEIISTNWAMLPQQHANVALDVFVIMPNHLHGIIRLNEPGNSKLQPLGSVIRGFKARCSRQFGLLEGMQHPQLWQRNYHEHVIRTEASLQSIREYITNNPQQWEIDSENPEFHP